jgi:hypothetical protein
MHGTVRVEEFGFIQLPVRLVDLSSAPIDGIAADPDILDQCADFYFADGSEEEIHLIDSPLTGFNWKPVGALNPVGLYHLTVPRRIFTGARRGPFQYLVRPTNPADFVAFAGFGTAEDIGQWVWDYDSILGELGLGGAGIVRTMGGVVRMLKQHFGGHVKVNSGTKRRTIFTEVGGDLSVVDTKDASAAASVDPIFETVPPVDTTPPVVVSVSPENTETNVNHDTVINVLFSEMMKESTINSSNITLFDTTGAPVAVPFSISLRGRVATLVPDAPLTACQFYTVTVSVNVKDVAGNGMASPVTATFRAAQDCGTPGPCPPPA